MHVVTNHSTLILWQEVIHVAEEKVAIQLQHEVEAYLVTLLMRYTNQPAVVRQIFATNFLRSLQLETAERNVSLQYVGDGCLLLAGLFPHHAQKRNVKISYFVNIGRSAYAAIANQTDTIFRSLYEHFVPVMDVLQAATSYSTLLPLEAYEQWNEIGSQRALQVLREYSHGFPLKK